MLAVHSTAGRRGRMLPGAGGRITDDCQAKVRLWAANPVVVPSPPAVPLPAFRPRRFRNHAEMNAWKRELLRELARRQTHG